jgi:spectinomycin phosphotransferase
MADKPEPLADGIARCLQGAYGLAAAQITPLPLGVDRNAAVYRIDAADGAAYFLKLRSDAFDGLSVLLPRFLSEQGIKQIIAPLSTRAGRLSAKVESLLAILYSFVEGQQGLQIRLSEQNWRELGEALRQLHATAVPPALAGRIRQEQYSSRWREAIRAFLEHVEGNGYQDRVAAELVALLNARRHEILDVVHRAEQLAGDLRKESPRFVLCHSDVHAANILIAADGALFIVDWDAPIMAPRERDLMFIGGAQGFQSCGPREEEALFYRGYGRTELNQKALAYYRYERVVEDIAVFCERLLLTNEGAADRERYLDYVASNFIPGGPIEMARRAERSSRVT